MHQKLCKSLLPHDLRGSKSPVPEKNACALTVFSMNEVSDRQLLFLGKVLFNSHFLHILFHIS